MKFNANFHSPAFSQAATAAPKVTSFGKIRLRRMDCSKRRAESHRPDFSQDDTAALKMMTSSSQSPVLKEDRMAVASANVSSNFAGLPICKLQDYLFKISHPSHLNLLKCMKPASSTDLVLSSSSKWSKA